MGSGEPLYYMATLKGLYFLKAIVISHRTHYLQILQIADSSTAH